MSWLTTDETATVKNLINDLEKNPDLLYQPNLLFLKNYIEGLGGIIPIVNHNFDETGGNDDDTGYDSGDDNDTAVVASDENSDNFTQSSSPKRFNMVAAGLEDDVDPSDIEEGVGRGKRKKIPKMCGLCREPLYQPSKNKKLK